MILVDDQALVREGLRALIERDPDLAVVATAEPGETLRIVASEPSDLVIVDVSRSPSGGAVLVRELKRELPDRAVLMLSAHQHFDIVAEALDSGAAGYALKSQSPSELFAAIRRVVAGERYIAPGLRAPSSDGNGSGVPAGLMRALSRREREIFDLLVRGDSNSTIARALFISVKTVETHRTRVMKKLEVHSIGELIRLAARHGHLAA
ncbi:MAG TPA: response regulator transcription factor [Polyangia bacterium]